ncbi:carboxymuconolactone decarboxylase family protein [Lysinibacillus agricola]|uniref:Carboxymuconolactone decarboxylase family protein n=1 Tax=Lysinibacillus agricola TaxID=2590012 RepID=A0ABX7AM27_9BACI|nr:MULTISPECIES: carboxymuconolactone decarboxylase family protein [Lysinibacillus]KOS62226.1 4-carboxymuconolactone decarboxylase [Lysinibacillus sp. FJAT-14222]QQP10981.1 carboxymuconolactone decarboxylase family protein [Lysinibacillus agricola]
MNDRFTKGLETVKQYVTEEEAARMIEADALADVAPDLRKMIIEFAYGDVYSRPGLDAKSRALVVITAVVSQGAAPQTKTHIKRGLYAGLTQTEIVEALLQLVPYIGFPRVQNALTIAQQVFKEEA